MCYTYGRILIDIFPRKFLERVQFVSILKHVVDPQDLRFFEMLIGKMKEHLMSFQLVCLHHLDDHSSLSYDTYRRNVPLKWDQMSS